MRKSMGSYILYISFQGVAVSTAKLCKHTVLYRTAIDGVLLNACDAFRSCFVVPLRLPRPRTLQVQAPALASELRHVVARAGAFAWAGMAWGGHVGGGMKAGWLAGAVLLRARQGDVLNAAAGCYSTVCCSGGRASS